MAYVDSLMIELETLGAFRSLTCISDWAVRDSFRGLLGLLGLLFGLLGLDLLTWMIWLLGLLGLSRGECSLINPECIMALANQPKIYIYRERVRESE